MQTISQLINDAGPAVALPIIIFVFALLARVRPGTAARSALKIGTGFVGINLIIGLLLNALGPAAKMMVTNYGLHLSVLDVGGPASAAIAFGSQVGALAIPVGLGVNVVLLLLGLTRTLDIDLWNYWEMAFVGAVVAVIMHSLVAGLVAVGIVMIVLLALADWSARDVQTYLEVPDVSLPHGVSAPYYPLAVLLDVGFKRIPGVRNWKADPETIQRRFGVLGDPIVVAGIIGVIIGALAYGFGQPRNDIIQILQLAVNLAAVMAIMPLTISLLMQGLLPLAESVSATVRKRFPGRDLYIGLDSAIAVGNQAVMATGLLLVPITLLLAVILPGNRVLPFTDLPLLPFIVAMMVPVFRGNVVRALIGGIIAVVAGLYIATFTAGAFTAAAHASHFAVPSGTGQVTSLMSGANPLVGAFVLAAQGAGWVGLVITFVLAIALLCWVRFRVHSRRVQAAVPEPVPAQAAEQGA